MRRTISGFVAAGAAIALSASCTQALTAVPSSPQVAPAAVPVALPRHSAIVTSTKLAAEYYRATLPHTTAKPTNGWSWATYAQGVQALYRQAGDQHYLNDGLTWGASNAWGIYTGSEEIDPDTIKAGQTYYDLHAINSTASLAVMDATMAKDLASQPVSRYDWIDALFMGLPNWTRWATRTGNSGYLTKLDALYLWMRDQGATGSRCAGKTTPQPGLFDPAQRLWYRDCRFVGAKDTNGKPIFWARGNGWVIAAMAQVLQTSPATDPRRTKYATMLKTMAARLIQLQGTDGLWRASLADPALYTQPETSGSALITYGLAYGVKAGILDSATYLPVVARAWNGLTTVSLQPNGFVTNCQPAGIQPAAPYLAKAPRTAPTSTSAGTVNVDSPPYCVGAFLLAGSAVAQLPSSPSTGRPVTFTGQQVGNEARHIDDGNVTTRWSASGFPKAVTIDLGANRSLSNAMVVPYLDRAYRYRIETSTDNVHWQLVVNQAGNTKTGSRLDNFTPGTVSARYARLTVVGVDGVTTTWASIQEFAVY
jgi:rhamnogalacturonyl hydrolase YesR